ncbi:hypothetical protein, partial [Haloferula sp.]|uniref:hypothetical protein n=1 Tax=Haloferula sp. TaxID=2497595 RepID=UPI003C74835D
ALPLGYSAATLTVSDLQIPQQKLLGFYTRRAKFLTVMSKNANTWTATRYQHLYRHARGGVYYARLTVNRKKTWRSLKTKIMSVARTELANLDKQEKEKSELVPL